MVGKGVHSVDVCHGSEVQVFTFLHHGSELGHEHFAESLYYFDLGIGGFAGNCLAVAEHMTFQTIIGLERLETVHTLVEP